MLDTTSDGVGRRVEICAGVHRAHEGSSIAPSGGSQFGQQHDLSRRSRETLMERAKVKLVLLIAVGQIG